MKKYIFKNGLKLIYSQKESKSIAVEVLVKVGSNNENINVLGISHFIEHMIFEGTKKRKNSNIISNEIEKLGGEINAYTSNDRTAFYIKILNKYFDVALDVLADIIQNSVFDPKTIEKERKVILKEIDMINDQPRFFQWILFQKSLYKKNNSRNPTYGTRKTVQSITRHDLSKYYSQYYAPNNIIISVVGNVENIKEIIWHKFKNFTSKKIPDYRKIIELDNYKQIIKIRKNLNNSYVVLGYKTPDRLSKESYVLDLILGVLGRGQSGRIFDEIRNKRGLAYEVGVSHESSIDHGYFAIYLNTDKKNIKNCCKIILKEFKKLKKINEQELDEGKTFIEGQFLMENDDNFQLADKLAFWELIKDSATLKNYLNEIKKINRKDISRVVDKFLNENYTLAVIEQDK